MTQQDHKQDPNDYLEGESELSQVYRSVSNQEPPAHVDDAVLAASRKAVKSRPRFAFSPFASDWHERAALAAVVVLCVVLVITLQQQASLPDATLVRPETPAVMSDEAVPESKEQRLEKESMEPAERGIPMEEHAAQDSLSPSRKMRVKPEQPLEQIVETPEPASRDKNGGLMKQVAPKMEKSEPVYPSVKTEKDADMADRSLLNKESDSAGISSGILLQDKIDKKESEQSVQESVLGGMAQDTVWLEKIKRLWEEGYKDQAQQQLSAFMQRYPDFEREDLLKTLDAKLINRVLPEAD